MSVPVLGRNPTHFTQLCWQDPSVGTSLRSSHMDMVTHKLGVAPTPAPAVLCILGGLQACALAEWESLRVPGSCC